MWLLIRVRVQMNEYVMSGPYLGEHYFAWEQGGDYVTASGTVIGFHSSNVYFPRCKKVPYGRSTSRSSNWLTAEVHHFPCEANYHVIYNASMTSSEPLESEFWVAETQWWNPLWKRKPVMTAVGSCYWIGTGGIGHQAALSGWANHDLLWCNID